MNRKKIRYILFLSILLASCSFAKTVTPEVLNNTTLRDFNSITFNAPGVLEIVQSSAESLEISGNPAFTSAIHAEVTNRALVISTTSKVPSNASISYKLSVKKINSIILNEFSVIKIPALDTDKLELEINGSGRIQLGNLEAQTLTVKLNGAGSFAADSITSVSTTISSFGTGNINITSGSADTLKLDLESGSFLGEGFKSLSADVSVNGTGSVLVWAAEKLDASINGAGRIIYFGEPVMSMSINGGGQISGGGRK